MAVLQRIRDMVIASQPNLDDSTKIECEDKNGDSRYMPAYMFRIMMGLINLTGDVTGIGYIGSIATTIANDAVSLAKMTHGTANRLVGYDGSGVPVEIIAGANVVISSGVISMSAPASASPSATLFTHRAFGGL